MNRRQFTASAIAVSTLATPLAALAQMHRDSLTLGMTLEPPGLDPTSGAASAIAEVVQDNIFETLVKIGPDGNVSPMLAERWEVAPDLRGYTFHLRPGVRFANGEPFNAAAVRFSFERAAAADSANKDKRNFTAIQTLETPDEHTVRLTIKSPDPNFLFYLGQATAAMVEPKSAATNATQPVGTGPYALERWVRGAGITLAASPSYRDAGAIGIKRAQFRFITDPAAQMAALLSGGVQVFTRVTSRGLARFRGDPELQVIISGSRAKTVLAINNARKPLTDVRVRRAICAAIDRKAIITAAADGLGVPIGSHYVPGMPGYVDTTGINTYDPARARALLKEAGIGPLTLSLVLPAAPYARQAGEVVIAELAQIGITARARNVEWAEWMANVYGGAHDYDLTIISHVEPFDLGNFAKPDYYWGYHSPAFNALYDQILHTADIVTRNRLLADAQKLLAQDAVLAWLYQPQWVTAARKEIAGLWPDMPIFVNDLAALKWT
ncbi:MAG: ABC transporter substrate-binding protein [Burkholderiaceae bacterium]|nr:ABC transporter substrate-binding protein [Burkholderiaceae bacterium]